MTFSVRRICLALASLVLAGTPMFCLAQAAPTAPSTIPLQDFFENRLFSDALLSPDGRTLAVRVAQQGGRIRLATMDLATMKGRIVAEFKDAEVGQVQWVNDHRLVYDLANLDLASGEVNQAPGLFAVNSDGSAYLQLANRHAGKIKHGPARDALPWNTFLLPSWGTQDSDDIYVQQPAIVGTHLSSQVALLKLNTVDGRTLPVSGPDATTGWLIDTHGEPRLAVSIGDGGKSRSIHYRKKGATEWRKLTEINLFQAAGAYLDPAFFGPDDRLYVYADYHDKRALFVYDVEQNTLGATPVVTLPEFDLAGPPVLDQHGVLGIRYEAETRGTWWLDARMQAVQAAVDAALPGQVNRLSVGLHSATPYVLVASTSDVQPTVYQIYNTDSKTFTRLGAERPAIVARQMGHQGMFHFKARDGLDIPVHLTLPAGGSGKHLPMVVLVHGGPWTRGGHWEWNPQVQFLASRGYAVLQPEFRGSTGFGRQHFVAGWKQWGLKMQDDIADGTKWAIAQGYADPQRICIAGASYGGYSVLMGLINDRDLFKCGVDWVGVTDIALLYHPGWLNESDLGGAFQRYGMPAMIGDLEQDAAQLRATSPLAQAGRIQQPLLLAYGGADRRVPLVHGRQFYDAVRQNNAQVEWVVYDEEGHGWALTQNRIDFWGRVEKFLDRNIGH